MLLRMKVANACKRIMAYRLAINASPVVSSLHHWQSSPQMHFSSFVDSTDFEAKNGEEQVKEQFYFKNYAKEFSFNNNSSLFDAKEGEYIEISKQDISLYFPEGLAGETAEEFEFSGENKWMIRDGSKILCRYLDNFAKTTTKSKK